MLEIKSEHFLKKFLQNKLDFFENSVFLRPFLHQKFKKKKKKSPDRPIRLGRSVRL